MPYHDEEDDLDTKSKETGELSISHASTTGSSSFARSETRRVTRSKYIVAAFIFVAAVLVGSLTFVFTRNQEEDDFETQVSFLSTASVCVCIPCTASNAFVAV